MDGKDNIVDNPNYKGKPENFVKDFKPAKDGKGKGKPKPPPKQNLKKPEIPSTLPKPTHNDVPIVQPTRDEPIWKDAIFGPETSAREIDTHITHTPSLSSLVEMSKQTAAVILAEDPNMQKLFVREAFHYYVGCIAWLRIIDIKQSRLEPLTQQEKQLDTLLKNVQINIPEPIYLYLKAVGTVEAKTGQHLWPAFPELPLNVINNNGGYFGALTVDTHNLYEELPCLGVLGEALRHSISNDPVGPYDSSLAPADLTMNANLLGFEPLTYRREEARSTFIALGVTPDLIPSSVPNTGFNFKVFTAMSGIVGQIKTFKIMTTTIHDMGISGAQAQLVVTKPTNLTLPVRNVENDNYCVSLSSESTGTYGLSIIAGFHRSKEAQIEPAQNASINNRSWCCVNFTGATAPTTIPANWIANRNIRRNLPQQFTAEVFRSISHNADQQREQIVVRLKSSKR